MTNFALLLSIFLLLQGCFAPPVDNKKKENEEKDSEDKYLDDYMEYHRYLKEVVNALESDPDFRKKLEDADEKDIKSGKIAEELDFVQNHIRTKLDEIKRVELERLKELTEKKLKLENGDNQEDPVHHHLDQHNPTFEIDDLKKLIAKTTADLAVADQMRKEEFKQYEMKKEFEKQDKLNHTNGLDREKLQKELEEKEKKHKKHEKLHQPGHKAQLEEVWEEQDQMQQDFDPKTFFMLHDIDGNGLWDQEEVKSLFISELNKMYQQGAPEDDMRERIEEMERMRESVFKEMDTNNDGFIDYTEFLSQTKSSDFKQDHGWQGLDEQKPFSDEEYEAYLRLQEVQRRAHAQGLPNHIPQQGGQYHPGQLPQHVPQPLPGHYDMNNNIHPQAAYQQQQAQADYHQQQALNYQQQYQGQGHPQQFQGQGHPQQFQGQGHPQQQYQGHPPPVQQQHQGQGIPPQQYQGQAPPQFQGQGLPPQQQYQGQVPQQQQQPPQGQQQPLHGQQQPPQGQQQPPQGQQQPPQGQKQPPQGQQQLPQGQQQAPQGQSPPQQQQNNIPQQSQGNVPQAQGNAVNPNQKFESPQVNKV